jgi:hypothetical protein
VLCSFEVRSGFLNTGLFKKDGEKIKACGESGKNGNRSITEGNEGEMLQVRACA